MELKLHTYGIQNLLLLIKITISNITISFSGKLYSLVSWTADVQKGHCQHSPSFTTTRSEIESTYTFSLIQFTFISAFKQKAGSEKLVQEYNINSLAGETNRYADF